MGIDFGQYCMQEGRKKVLFIPSMMKMPFSVVAGSAAAYEDYEEDDGDYEDYEEAETDEEFEGEDEEGPTKIEFKPVVLPKEKERQWRFGRSRTISTKTTETRERRQKGCIQDANQTNCVVCLTAEKNTCIRLSTLLRMPNVF
jgi:hypothetical protein